MIRGSAIHIAYRILAAFFIDMGAKTSIVENLSFINHKLIYSFLLINSKNSVMKHYQVQLVISVLTLLMILPQVHLRKPCYDFSFL